MIAAYKAMSAKYKARVHRNFRIVTPCALSGLVVYGITQGIVTQAIGLPAELLRVVFT